MMSSVSAIIPVYDGEATIAQAVDSALALAGEGDLEVVVVDDGSSDSTLAILESYSDRIRLLRQDHRGVSAARNHAVRESRGDYLAFLDADDLWLRGRLSTAVKTLDAHPTVGLVYCRSWLIDIRDGRQITERGIEDPPSLEDMFQWRFSFHTPAVTMRRDLFEHCGGFDERLSVGEDVVLWLSARERCDFLAIPQHLAVCRTRWDPDAWSKYSVNAGRALVDVLPERYGRRAKKAIDIIISTFLISVLCRLDDGNPVGALRPLFQVVRYRPFFLFRWANLARLVRRRNLRQISVFWFHVAGQSIAISCLLRNSKMRGPPSFIKG